MTTTSAAPADTGTKLAIDRTRLAYERTMMAWIRTAASLISFGFTIYKFFQFEVDKAGVAPGRFIGPRGFGLLMIGAGLTTLLLATIEQRMAMKSLRATYGPQPYSTAAAVAALISILGLVAFVAVLLRM